MTNEFLWALAPEHADAVFETYRAELDVARTQPRAEGAETRGMAGEISRNENGVAVISISAPIDRQTKFGWFTGNIYAIGQDAIRKAVADALADHSVRAILLSVNSPGGVVAGIKELADFIAEAATQKSLGAYVNGTAASAAFWLASATGRVFAPATAQVGSIGVIMTLADYSGFYQKVGMRIEHIASGKYKAAGRGERALTDEEREYFQEQVADLHAIFKADVARHLKITTPEPQWAEAQILVGQRALSTGLVSTIVRDEAQAVQILLEETMPETITLEFLTANAPELLEQIQAQAKTEAAAAADETVQLLMATMKATLPAEQTERVEALLAKAQKLNLTSAQLAGMADLLAIKNDDLKSEERGNAAMLEALRQAHAAPVNAGTNQPEKSALVADAERRARGAK